ncbi:MAG: FAD-binding protein [Ruminococcaceae bacterium]|nr:FAD-binding protein [Oscillospiraceae bacterium]
MESMEKIMYEFDAVVIGTGCAGYNCADWLYTFGYKNIAIITEGRLKGTSRNTGSDKQTYYKMSLAGDNGDSVYEMAKTLFDGGAMDGDIAISEAANSIRSFMKLANLGVDFPTNEYGEYVGYKTDHDPFCRATSIGPYTSKKMTEVLEDAVMAKNIRILDNYQVVKILTDNGKATGLIAVSTVDSKFITIKAPHIVLATGGPAAIYYDSVYPESHTGSTGLAYEAGASLTNLAEWQYGLASIDFRWNVSGTYQQVLPRYISIDDEGVEREFLLDYYATPEEAIKNVFLKGYEWPFDVRKIHGSSYVDLIVYLETVIKGRKVYMDFTREPTGLENGFDNIDEVSRQYLANSDALIALPIERLRKMNPGAISLYKDHGIDITKEPLRIAVCAQHNNGGVRIDSNWQTNVEGLYTIGEAAGSLGIFRPGGSALNSCQVGGLRAATHIAYQSKNKVSDNFDAIADNAMKEISEFVIATRGEDSTIAEMREKYQKAMSKNFAFLRNLETMADASGEIATNVENFVGENKWQDSREIPDLFKNHDICMMQLAVSQSILKTAELYGSRGSGFVFQTGSFMDREPVSEKPEGRATIITLKKEAASAKPVFDIVPVRPLPDRNLWFEKVWNEYNEMRGI